MRQIYEALLKVQQEIGHNCSVTVELEVAMYLRPNLMVTCRWPDEQLKYRFSYPYDYIDKFHGDPFRYFIEGARRGYEKVKEE